MMGLVTGDALGNAIQFMSREEVRERGFVHDMEEGGVYETPAGTWTDDSSMALVCKRQDVLAGYAVTCLPLYACIWTHGELYCIRVGSLTRKFIECMHKEGFSLDSPSGFMIEVIEYIEK